MNPKIEQFIKALNEAYTKQNVNGAATATQTGRSTWLVKCAFDSHHEHYDVIQVGENDWTFRPVYIFGG